MRTRKTRVLTGWDGSPSPRGLPLPCIALGEVYGHAWGSRYPQIHRPTQLTHVLLALDRAKARKFGAEEEVNAPEAVTARLKRLTKASGEPVTTLRQSPATVAHAQAVRTFRAHRAAMEAEQRKRARNELGTVSCQDDANDGRIISNRESNHSVRARHQAIWEKNQRFDQGVL